ncbi:MAG: nicotinamide-nucleotide amidohydrolase family protein [Gammaproteobacteria bacterium]
MPNPNIINTVEQLAENLTRLSAALVTAESCTGGGLAEHLTSIAGSSAWFDRGFVTYSNEAKVELLNVSRETLEQFGAVSEQTAAEMVAGALANSHAQFGVSVTGIAGPDGGTDDKPVGTVCFGWYGATGEIKTTRVQFNGDRQQVREQACLLALQGLIDITSQELE